MWFLLSSCFSEGHTYIIQPPPGMYKTSVNNGKKLPTLTVPSPKVRHILGNKPCSFTVFFGHSEAVKLGEAMYLYGP